MSFLLAFGFQYPLKARLGGLNVFLLYAVRPLLEAMEDLDSSLSVYIQNSIPRSLILLAQFINARAYRPNRFSVGRSLTKLQAVQRISEIVPDSIRKRSQHPYRVTLKDSGDQGRRLRSIFGLRITCIHVTRMSCHYNSGNQQSPGLNGPCYRSESCETVRASPIKVKGEWGRGPNRERSNWGLAHPCLYDAPMKKAAPAFLPLESWAPRASTATPQAIFRTFISAFCFSFTSTIPRSPAA